MPCAVDMATQPPFVDEHAIDIAAPREAVWAGLQRQVAAMLAAEGGVLRTVLGTEPRAGFAVAETAPPERLVLVGRHRFARYRLAFELDDAEPGATRLRARTFAAFPGMHGRVYRALVIGSRAHVVATRQILRSIRRRTLG
jgi:hypothetical protein